MFMSKESWAQRKAVGSQRKGEIGQQQETGWGASNLFGISEPLGLWGRVHQDKVCLVPFMYWGPLCDSLDQFKAAEMTSPRSSEAMSLKHSPLGP